ncbi:MAG: glycoside hydrolase family 9 protein [Massilibacteroides sp.]|nr:glycoside hydrolase family 9 protein [Massilibacteroides sp.]
MKNYFLLPLVFLLLFTSLSYGQQLKLNDLDYFETRGVNVLVYSNKYNPVFFDEKTAGIELIHHGVRTATGGAVRLHNTPEQWDLVPAIINREVDRETNTISTVLRYEDFDFNSELKVTSQGKGFTIQVILDKPVPDKLIGRAGLNLEFFPSVYWESRYMADGKPKLFPRYPSSNASVKPKSQKIQQIYDHSTFDDRGRGEFLDPLPISSAKTFVFAPNDPKRRITISSESDILFFDGRLLAQNGCYVIRSMLPAGKTGKVMEWYIEANAIPGWTREPVIGFSQVGYIPEQQKIAVIELDKNDNPDSTATLYRVSADGTETVKFSGNTKVWGKYLRYHYLTFDFSSVKEPGIYYLEYGGLKTNTFSIDKNIYDDIWHTTMDVWLPVQMDHMTVNEGYRVWHGTPYEDDAIQAPLNHKHFDGYSMGDTTDTRFKPFERIPGLTVGGWYDAGDFDIQTGSHNSVIMDLVQIYETFTPDRDMTYVDQKTKYTDLHRPDGKNDILQQVEHGVLALVAQIENIGHPVRGIIVGNLHQYHHLGDAATITDNLPYNSKLKPYESDGLSSGTMDDRWVFTNRSSFMDYNTAAALAAASRVLKEFNPDLSGRALACATKMWDENANKPAETTPRRGNFSFFGSGNLSAALQLYITTKDTKYKKEFEDALWKLLDAPMFNTYMPGNISIANGISYAFAAYPYMDRTFHEKLYPYIQKYKEESDIVTSESPYGVPMGGRGWAGNGQIMSWAINNYFVNKYYPEIMDKEYIYKGLNYLFGCHPDSNISFVAAIGAKSKKMIYGNNRADFTFIAGGVVPGLLFLQPDFYENKDDWPFIWGENEAIITTATPYIFLANAVKELANKVN